MSNAVPKVTGAPESIWLCYGPLTRDLTHPKYYSPYDDDEITWHERSIYSSDVKYVRADMVMELLDALKDILRIAKAASHGHNFNDARIKRAEAAIAKAEGVLHNCD